MSFDRIAPHYRWMELVLAGEKLQRCRTAFLGKDKDLEKVLILGEGNGRFLMDCRRQLKDAQLTCVDSSRRMLALAQKRLARAGLDCALVDFIYADALSWKPPSGVFDAIVTHFFLDCFRWEQLEALIASLSRAAKPAAVWLLADFQIPPARLARMRAVLIHKMMYWFFRLMCGLAARELSPPDPLLRAQGFSLHDRCTSEWGLLHTDRWVRE
jgi:ubiquinone/menaquinone biosynthesis C-methylase UbiE